MRIATLTFALLVFTSMLGCAHSDPWTKRDTIMQVGVTAVYVADAVTTSRIQYHEGVHEAGLARYALGSQPSTSDTYQYFGTLMISNWVISRALPAKWRPYWQGVNIAAHGSAAINNCQLGLC